jgi:hypothetical protein
MTQNLESSLISQDAKTTKLARIAPASPPVLIEKWVVWELKVCLDTNGIKLNTEHLHDLLKVELEAQGVPVDIFFAKDASWIIEGARGRAKVDNDFRPRVVAKLKPQNSPYTDMQFIAGIDYFGKSNWADVQMMMIVQPEEIRLPPRPTPPREPNTKGLIPNEAIVGMAVVALALTVSGNSALQLLGFIGLIGLIGIYIKSTTDVRKDRQSYEGKRFSYERELADWENEKEQIVIEREELIRNRLSRSFKTDDLRIFHTVLTRSIARIISDEFLKQGAAIKEAVENNDAQIAISSSKNIFDEF